MCIPNAFNNGYILFQPIEIKCRAAHHLPDQCARQDYGGGFSLAREPEDITLLQIVSAVEGEIHTYPNNGLLDLVFSDFKPIATEGNSAINAAFDAADQLWRQALDKVTIYDLLCQTLGTVDVPKVDWNKLQLSPSEQATAIIDKIRTNLRSVR